MAEIRESGQLQKRLVAVGLPLVRPEPQDKRDISIEAKWGTFLKRLDI